MTGHPHTDQPGLCVIVNNTNFKNESPIPGGEKDE